MEYCFFSYLGLIEHWDQTFPGYEAQRLEAEKNAKKLLASRNGQQLKISIRGLRERFIEMEKTRLKG